MITIDDKLETFYKLVFKEEEAKSKEILEELEKRNKSLIAEKKLELEEKKQETIKRKKKLAEIQKNEMVSKATQDNRKEILSKSEELLEDVIESLKRKSEEFTKSKGYEDYILGRIENVIKSLEEKEIIISLRENDKSQLEDSIIKIGKKYNKTILFNEVRKDIIGGFIISDQNKTYNLDNSFKTIIEQNRYDIGKRLHISLGEAGDLRG
jgi:vacuolar-type H+-ATPase subunit E/Vma4